MFRVVTECVEKPGFLLLCDEHTCGQMISVELQPGANVNQAASGLLSFAGQNGWGISITRHLCPAHLAKARGEERRIEVVSSLVARN